MTVDVLTFGETLALVQATNPGPLRSVTGLRLSIAGAESTVAIGLARLGHRVRWVGRVGPDEFGELVLHRLRGEGIDVVGARAEAGVATGLLVREQRTADIARVQYYRADSAGSRIAGADLTPSLEDGARVLSVSGITPALSPSALQATRLAVEYAAAHGWTISLDINYRSRLWSSDDAAATLRPLVERSTIVIGDAIELALVGGTRALLDAGVREVVTKLGAQGACVTTTGGEWHRTARPVTVVDVVGAGDAFVAGYLSALLDGADPAARLLRATTVASFSVSCTGDWEGLPSRDELTLAALESGTTVR